MYIVTNGSYSDYSIMGVFDNLEKAEKFQEFYNYELIEEFDLNPGTPVFKGHMYRGYHSFESGDTNVQRTGNDKLAHELQAGLRFQAPGDLYSIYCCFQAMNQLKAELIFQDTINSFKLGVKTAKAIRGEHECGMRPDGTPDIFSKIAVYEDTYIMEDGVVKVSSRKMTKK